MNSDNPVITIDGPAASGKGTLAERLSYDLRFNLLDSGLLYRIVAYVANQAEISLTDQDALFQLMQQRMQFLIDEDLPEKTTRGMYEIFIQKNIGFKDHVTINRFGRNLELRSHEIGRDASFVASLPAVRKQLIPIQRSFRKAPGLIADGRDMGTVVFPDAPMKFFLDATVSERARRRQAQLAENDEHVDLEELEREIADRDERDKSRDVAPLKSATDAVVINSSMLSIDEVVAQAKEHVKEKLGV